MRYLVFGTLTLMTIAGCGTTGQQSRNEHQLRDQETYEFGKKIFEMKCRVCHSLTEEKKLGPGLGGVLERYDEEWVEFFIQDSQAMVKSGDKKAITIYKEYGMQMPSHQMSDEEMNSLIFFLKRN